MAASEPASPPARGVELVEPPVQPYISKPPKLHALPSAISVVCDPTPRIFYVSGML